MWANTEKGFKKLLYQILSLYSHDISPQAVAFDKKAVNAITIVGIPSAFLLHGYVGFIFGSVKANPWWSSVLMPIVFLFSAIVSGIALMLIIYTVVSLVRKEEPDMACLDKLASFLFYVMIVDFSLECLDFIHRVYQSEESIQILLPTDIAAPLRKSRSHPAPFRHAHAPLYHRRHKGFSRTR